MTRWAPGLSGIQEKPCAVPLPLRPTSKGKFTVVQENGTVYFGISHDYLVLLDGPEFETWALAVDYAKREASFRVAGV